MRKISFFCCRLALISLTLQYWSLFSTLVVILRCLRRLVPVSYLTPIRLSLISNKQSAIGFHLPMHVFHFQILEKAVVFLTQNCRTWLNDNELFLKLGYKNGPRGYIINSSFQIFHQFIFIGHNREAISCLQRLVNLWEVESTRRYKLISYPDSTIMVQVASQWDKHRIGLHQEYSTDNIIKDICTSCFLIFWRWYDVLIKKFFSIKRSY